MNITARFIFSSLFEKKKKTVFAIAHVTTRIILKSVEPPQMALITRNDFAVCPSHLDRCQINCITSLRLRNMETIKRDGGWGGFGGRGGIGASGCHSKFTLIM